MRVLIAGGGIGGLAAALACSRAGCAVDLFEKTAAFEAIGAGIQLGPNVTRILHAWGLERALKDVAAYPDNLLVRDANTGNLLGQLRLGQKAVQRYGAPYATLHRADLHQLLWNALAQQPSAKIRLDAAFDGFTQSESSPANGLQIAVKKSDGTVEKHHGDALVGADGLWSQVRQQLVNDDPPRPSGHVAFRSLIAQNNLPAALQSQDIQAWLGPQMHAVTYPVRGGEWLNVVVIVEAAETLPETGWNTPFTPEKWLKAAYSKHGQLSNLLQYAEAWQAWNLFDRAPIASAEGMVPRHDALKNTNQCVALLGDAAHPMLPYLAQGAGMAIEDANELATCLASSDDVAKALQHYAQNRWQRNTRVQARALRNGQIFHATGVVKWGRDLAMKALGEKVLDMPWLYKSMVKNTV
jgi:salicylate hydroxylase